MDESVKGGSRDHLSFLGFKFYIAKRGEIVIYALIQGMQKNDMDTIPMVIPLAAKYWKEIYYCLMVKFIRLDQD